MACVGGAEFIIQSMMADVIDYDRLLSGEDREAQYEVAIDFIPKLGMWCLVDSCCCFFMLV